MAEAENQKQHTDPQDHLAPDTPAAPKKAAEDKEDIAENEQDLVIEEDSEKTFALLEERINKAKKVIKKAPHSDYRGDILYGIPWFLFVGNHSSNIKSVLRAANYHDPVPPLYKNGEDPDALWSWWFLKKLVAIDVNADAIGDTLDNQKQEYWHKALYLLQKNRKRTPVNGVVVCISATDLIEAQKTSTGEEKVQNFGKQIRNMIDECQKRFYLQFPVTILITQLDKLNSFQGFIDAMPPHLETQALGYKFQPTLKKDKIGFEGRVNTAFQHFHNEMTPLKLGLIRKHKNRQNPYPLFAFPEHIQQMKHGVAILAEALFGENPYQYKPFWRGLYMAAEDSNTPFMQDLFEKFLPADQPLARKR